MFHSFFRRTQHTTYSGPPPADDPENLNNILITVSGEQAVGKTTVLEIILGALADHGLLSVQDTKHITQCPESFLAYSRIVNEARSEAVEIDISMSAVLGHVKARSSVQ